MKKHIKFSSLAFVVVGIFLILVILNQQFLLLNKVLKSDSTPVPEKTPIIASSPAPTATPTPTSTPKPTSSPKPTPKPTSTPKVISAPNLEDLFNKYSAEYGVSKDLLKKIAGCESGFNTTSVGGDYAGMFQFSSGAWVSTRQKMGLSGDLSLRFNAEESIKTAAFKISQSGTSAWSACD